MAIKKSKIQIRVRPTTTPIMIDPEFDVSADGASELSISRRQLSQMNNDDLMDRAFQIDEMATIMFWKIIWIVRQRFDSDTLFGRYIEEYRLRSAGTLCPSNRKEIYRAWIAGKFCETYGIEHLSSIGLTKTSIYELGSPKNEDVAGEVFAEIKESKEPVPVHEVRRLLKKAKSIDALVETSRVITQPENIACIRGSHVEIGKVIVDIDEGAIDEIITLVKSQQSVAFVKRLINELQKMVDDSAY